MPQQIPSHQSGLVATANSSQQMVYTTSTGAQNHQPLPSIATLARKPQAQPQQQQFQLQQQLQQQQQQQQRQQQQQQPMQMDFQMPPIQGGAMGGQVGGDRVKMESENKYCGSMDTAG